MESPHDLLERKQRVLVADDHEHSRVLMETHLLGAGYEVHLANDGPQALRMFAALEPDLVVLDALMPGMDGFETCARLRNLPGGVDVPILFLTAISNLAAHERALEVGADDFLMKPINRTELLLHVEMLIGTKRIKDELVHEYSGTNFQRNALAKAQHTTFDFATIFVHDLRNPLSVVLANLDHACESDTIDDGTRAVLREAREAAETIHGLTHTLLAFFGSDGEPVIPRPEPCDIAEVTQRAIEAMTRCAEQRDQRLDATLQATVLHIDRELTQRAIESALEHACRRAPTGSTIEVSLRSRDSGVEIDIQPEEIRSDGVTAPPDDARRVHADTHLHPASDTIHSHARARKLPSHANGASALWFARFVVESQGGVLHLGDEGHADAAIRIQLPRLRSGPPV